MISFLFYCSIFSGQKNGKALKKVRIKKRALDSMIYCFFLMTFNN